MVSTELCMLCDQDATYYLQVTYHRGPKKKHKNLPVCERHSTGYQLLKIQTLLWGETPKGFEFDSYAPKSIEAIAQELKHKALKLKWAKSGLQFTHTAVRVTRDKEE